MVFDREHRELFNEYNVSILQNKERLGDWLLNNVNIFNTDKLYT